MLFCLFIIIVKIPCKDQSRQWFILPIGLCTRHGLIKLIYPYNLFKSTNIILYSCTRQHIPSLLPRQCQFFFSMYVFWPSQYISLSQYFHYNKHFSNQSHYRCYTSWRPPKCLRSQSWVKAERLSWWRKIRLLFKWSAGALRVAFSVWLASQPTSSCIASANKMPTLR